MNNPTRSLFKEVFSILLRLTGGPFLIRAMLQRRRVTVLVYHRLDPSTADRHFQTLRRLYTPISLQAYLRARRDSTLERLPPKSLVITIDDGHRSIYRLKDVIAKHQLPVTVFLCSGFVGTNRQFWFLSPKIDSQYREYLKIVPDETRI